MLSHSWSFTLSLQGYLVEKKNDQFKLILAMAKETCI